MLQIYLMYDRDTGFIESGGKIDLEWDAVNRDGSTTTEGIERRLLKFPNQNVTYLANQRIPNKEEYKISKGRIVALTVEEVEAVTKPRLDEAKINEEINAITRATAIQNLKDRGELEVDFVSR